MKKHVLTTVAAAAIAVSAVVPYNVLSTPVAHAEETKGKPDYKTREEIPVQYKWNLEDMYKSKAAWEADVKKAEDLSAKFKKDYQGGKIGKNVVTLANALKDYSALSTISDRAYVYANLSFDVNQSNSDLQALTDRAEKMSAKISGNTAWLKPEITSIPTKTMEKILRNKTVAPYKYFLKDMVRTKAHTLTKEEEELLAKVSPLSDTGTNVYAMLAKDVKFPMIKDSSGKDVQLTRSNFISYMESKDRNVRKQAYEAYYQTLGKFQDSFSQTLAAQVKGHNIGAEVRHYKSALEAAVTPNNVPSKVYDQLISSVNKGLPLMHRYMELKKKMLNVDELHMYDIYTPIVDADDTYIPYEDAKGMVLDGLKPMGDDYLNVLKKAFDERWVDVYSTDDKATGAYQWGSYDKHPYLLLNYQGTKDDVSTIAHELGHAVNSYMSSKKQNYLNSNYATFTAEVASTLNEALLWNSEYKNAKTKEEKLFLLNQRLENFRTTLFRQTQFAEFEKKIHELDQKGEALNAETFKKVYGEINQKYYGKAMAADEEIPMEWARIPHFYNYNFYVYQYATSFAASTALSKQITDEGAPAVNRVKGFLAAGGSTDPISILKGAGVDMSTSKPIDQAMQVFEETLNEMEKLMNEK
ncbi:oligoendopeptidase F [Bacillus sp. FJAT-42376]|uniref:oligoendopeptidase F n=1 Tax=Bacillus sp. FJAT-42376 TaxID=2014076 RepID=UPI000F4EC8CD|nr:oligoendopeptidase F [Bacillus sp. FJAT-42376]AZB44624.1 oligoendopeptidase F [Bacillus sp. FJAT-42376]